MTSPLSSWARHIDFHQDSKTAASCVALLKWLTWACFHAAYRTHRGNQLIEKHGRSIHQAWAYDTWTDPMRAWTCRHRWAHCCITVAENSSSRRRSATTTQWLKSAVSQRSGSLWDEEIGTSIQWGVQWFFNRIHIAHGHVMIKHSRVKKSLGDPRTVQHTSAMCFMGNNGVHTKGPLNLYNLFHKVAWLLKSPVIT